MDVMEHPFFQAANHWLRSAKAVGYAERVMSLQAVHVSAEEVLGDARRKIWVRLTKNPDGLDTAAAEPYCRTVVRSVVTDLLRGFEHEPFGAPEGPPPISYVLVASPMFEQHDSTVADGLRTAIEAARHPEPWVTSAALSWLTLSQYPDVDVSGSPLPKAGARPDQARVWPCVWFAGKTEGFFPGDGGGDAAQRKRLNRAAEKVNDAVKEAATLYWSAGTPS